MGNRKKLLGASALQKRLDAANDLLARLNNKINFRKKNYRVNNPDASFASGLISK